MAALINNTITVIATGIMAGRNGKALFTIEEASEIISVHRNGLGHILHKMGGTATLHNKRKYYTAIQLAEYVASLDKISPIAKTSERGRKPQL